MVHFDKNYWFNRIKNISIELNFDNGFKLVYGKWSTLYNAETAFLTMHPGTNTPVNLEQPEEVSDERGNTFVAEKYTTRSGITSQFLALMDLLRLNPDEVLTGVMIPFRMYSWDDCTVVQKNMSRQIAQEFWAAPLLESSIKRIIICSNPVRDIIISMTQAKLVKMVASNRKGANLRLYVTPNNNLPIVHLPSLNRFRLLSNSVTKQTLQEFFADCGWIK